MPIFRPNDIIQQANAAGVTLKLSPDGQNIIWKRSPGTTDAQFNAVRPIWRKHKASVISYLSHPELGKIRESIQTANQQINNRFEPNAQKHPILNSLYPESATAKAVLGVPSLIAGAGMAPETAVGAAALGAGVGTSAGLLSGEGAGQGALNGALSGIRLPGFGPTQKAIAKAYDKEVAQAASKALSHLPNTSKMLQKGARKWWEIMRYGKHDVPGLSVGEREAGDLYEAGMTKIGQKLDTWGQQKALDEIAKFKQKYGFAIGGKPPQGFQITDKFKADVGQFRKRIAQALHTRAEFNQTVKLVQKQSAGAFEQIKGNLVSGVTKDSPTGKTALDVVNDKNDELTKTLTDAGNALGEDLAGDYRSLKDQYSKFQGIKDLADSVANAEPITKKPGDVRTDMENLMQFLHKKSGPLESKLKDSWVPFAKTVLRDKTPGPPNFSAGMDVEGKPLSAGIAHARVSGFGRIPSMILSPLQFFMNRPVRVGAIPPPKIPPLIAREVGRLGGSIGGQNLSKSLIPPDATASPEEK